MKEKKISKLILNKDGRFSIEGTEIYYKYGDSIRFCINEYFMEFIEGVVKYSAYYKHGYYVEYKVKVNENNDIFIMSYGSLVEYEID